MIVKGAAADQITIHHTQSVHVSPKAKGGLLGQISPDFMVRDVVIP